MTPDRFLTKFDSTKPPTGVVRLCNGNPVAIVFPDKSHVYSSPYRLGLGTVCAARGSFRPLARPTSQYRIASGLLNRTQGAKSSMSAPMVGILVGGILGLLDGLSAWFYPEARTDDGPDRRWIDDQGRPDRPRGGSRRTMEEVARLGRHGRGWSWASP